MELKRITHAENVRLSDSGRAVRILDQSRLPNETVYLELSQAEDLYEAIASLRVRGAPAIGIFAGYALYVLALQSQETQYGPFLEACRRNRDYLNSSRPTAVNLRHMLDRVLAVCAPWGIVGSAVVLLGAGWYLYAAAKRRFAAGDGEDEDAMDAAEQQLSWALLLTGLVIILDFFFFAASIIYDRFLPDLILFLASVAVLVVLQQKIVDLERRINPEKRGSVYDMKFQKTWMDSCDEAERAQIGQACYRAYMVGTKVCIFLWVALLILNFVFDFGLLPIAAVLAVWGAMQIVYALECIRLSKRTGDA